MRLLSGFLSVVLGVGGLALFHQVRAAETLTFASPHFVTAQETQALKSEILAKLPVPAQYEPVTSFTDLLPRVMGENIQSAPDVLALEREEVLMLISADQLAPLELSSDSEETSSQVLRDRQGRAVALPWMQSGYGWVAHKRALSHLPIGANVDQLSYDQMVIWAQNMSAATHRPRLVLPAGYRGLLHRLVHDHLLWSYGDPYQLMQHPEQGEAVWKMAHSLWRETDAVSLHLETVVDHMADDQGWLGFDHLSRLVKLVEANPDQYVLVPNPKGPERQGHLDNLLFLVAPKTGAHADKAAKLVGQLMERSIQSQILQHFQRFPFDPAVLKSCSQICQRAAAQLAQQRRSPTPPLLGAHGQRTVAVAIFSRVSLRDQNWSEVAGLARNLLPPPATKMQAILPIPPAEEVQNSTAPEEGFIPTSAQQANP